MIRLDNITLTFPDGDNRVTAVNQVSLTAHPGTVTGITGPSGSGKSSLLAVAATLIRPDSGQVIIDDIDALIAEEPNNPYFRELKGQILFEAGRAETEAVAALIIASVTRARSSSPVT